AEYTSPASLQRRASRRRSTLIAALGLNISPYSTGRRPAWVERPSSLPSTGAELLRACSSSAPATCSSCGLSSVAFAVRDFVSWESRFDAARLWRRPDAWDAVESRSAFSSVSRWLRRSFPELMKVTPHHLS